MQDMDIAALRELEAECLLRFRKRASELRGKYPTFTWDALLAKAAESLPASMNKYLYAVSRLNYAGLPARPWK
jgi:hypothetical protein